jgi:acyl-[acyl-carrier-protein] desaturase
VIIFEEVKNYKKKDLPYDFLVTLVGDTITEEALPTYESWLMDVEGIDNVEKTVGQNGLDNGRVGKSSR